MKFLLKIIGIAILCFALQLFLPWWVVVMVCFAAGTFTGGSGSQNFFAGFFGVGGLWFGLAYYVDQKTDSMLTQRIAELFFLPNSFLLLLVTAAVGGLVGGFGALSGGLLNDLLFGKQARNMSPYRS